MALKGIDFVVQAKDSGGTYQTIAGQRGATLSIDTDDIDVSSKDGGGWEENLPGLRSWSIDFDALHSETDTGLQRVEDQAIAGNQVEVRLETPAGNFFEGTATITSFEIDAPHDDAATASGTLTGDGALSEV